MNQLLIVTLLMLSGLGHMKASSEKVNIVRSISVGNCVEGTQGKTGFEIPVADLKIILPQIELKRTTLSDGNFAQRFSFALLRGAKVGAIYTSESTKRRV